MRLSIASCAVLMLLAPAYALDSPLEGTWIDTVMRGGPDAPEPFGVEPIFDGMRIGKLQIGLETSRLSDLASSFGGTEQHWGEAGEAASWLCYTEGAQTLWFYADSEMGSGTVTGIGIDARDAAPAGASCTDFPGAHMDVDFDAPLIGASADEVRARFGPSAADARGWFRYWSFTPIEGHPTFVVWQEVTFRELDGVIDAFAIRQLTGD